MSSTRPASQRAPSRGGTPSDDRAAALGDLRARGRSTCCSPSTCSTRASTSPTSTPCFPPAHGELDDLPAAAWPRPSPHARQGRAHGARLRRLPPQGVQLRRSKFGALTGDTRRALEKAVKEDFPFLPSGCQIAPRQADARGRAGEHQVADRQPVGSRSSPSSASRGRLARGVPRVLRSRAERHPAARQPLLDASSARTPASRRSAGSDLEEKLLKRVRAFAHVDDPSVRRPIARCCRRVAVATPTCRPPSSASLGCSTTRSGPTAEASPRIAEGFEAHASRGGRTRQRSRASST